VSVAPRPAAAGGRQPLAIAFWRWGWIAVQLLLAYLFAVQGELFFYQGF
jgi:hypothetical protein